MTVLNNAPFNLSNTLNHHKCDRYPGNIYSRHLIISMVTTFQNFIGGTLLNWTILPCYRSRKVLKRGTIWISWEARIKPTTCYQAQVFKHKPLKHAMWLNYITVRVTYINIDIMDKRSYDSYWWMFFAKYGGNSNNRSFTSNSLFLPNDLRSWYLRLILKLFRYHICRFKMILRLEETKIVRI